MAPMAGQESAKGGRMVLLFAMLAALVLAVIGAVAVAAEFYLRGAGLDPSRRYILLPGWQIAFEPSPAGTPGVTKTALTRVNNLGLRGEVPSSRAQPRILTFGGSTTEDVMLDFSESWPGVAQTMLRNCNPDAWVGNAGKAGTNARHHLLQITEILPRMGRIDAITVLSGLNDMLYDFHIHHPFTYPPDWMERQAFMVLPSKDARWHERLALVALARRLLAPQPEQEKFRIVPFGTMSEGYKARRRAVLEADFIHHMPNMEKPLATYRQTLSAIADVAARAGTKVIFITQPSIWSDQMTPEAEALLYAGGIDGVDRWSKDPRTPWYHHRLMNRMMERYNDEMRGLCRERNLTCVDLAAELPKSTANYYDDFHFSAAGAAAVAQIVESRLPGTCKAR